MMALYLILALAPPAPRGPTLALEDRMAKWVRRVCVFTSVYGLICTIVTATMQ